MLWKVSNISKGPVKISVQKSQLVTVGVILQAGEFCLCQPQLTTPMDAQERRRFIKIDRNYSNDYKLEVSVNHSETSLADAIKKASEYTAETK